MRSMTSNCGNVVSFALLLALSMGGAMLSGEEGGLPTDPAQRLWQAVLDENYKLYTETRQEVLSLSDKGFSQVITGLRQRDDWRATFLLDGLLVRRAHPVLAKDFDQRLSYVIDSRRYSAALTLMYHLDGAKEGRLDLRGDDHIKTRTLGLEMSLVPMPAGQNNQAEHDPDLLRAELVRECIWNRGSDMAWRKGMDRIAAMMRSPPSWYPPRALLNAVGPGTYRVLRGMVEGGDAGADRADLMRYLELIPGFMDEYRRQKVWTDHDILALVRILGQLDEAGEGFAGAALEELRNDERASTAIELYEEEVRRLQEARDQSRKRREAREAAERANSQESDEGKDPGEKAP
ncbi:MAG: hypothetical protein EA402_11105 [Planctomycetota bacterium]|nr:MAG: hypothetical protein EA402_11105 [Planctomycetota bacterium]